MFGQTNGTGDFHIRGALTLTGDIYTFQSDSSIFRPQRPLNLWRLIFTPTIQFSEQIVLPFNIVLSSIETNETTPRTGGSSFMQFLLSPVNNIGLASFSPQIGWAKFYLGSHVPQYSNLSAGDYQIFGAGVDLRPGKFRFSSSAGIVQRAIEPDSQKGIPGTYSRWIYMTKIGYGVDEGSFMDLNIVRLRDDPASISKRPEYLRAEEGLLISTNFRAPVDEHISFTGEIGTSAFTRDMTASNINEEYALLSPFIHQRISTRVDYAGEFFVHANYPVWGVKGGVTYISPGYVALGYPYLQSDRLEFLLSPSVRLFENSLNIDASLGHRADNLLETAGTTTTQIIGSVNVFTTPIDELSISMSYSNFGVRNNQSLDTLRIQNVAQSISISPSYSIPTSDINHLISASALFDIYDEYNTITRSTNSNRTQSFSAFYSASFLSIPLSANVSLQHFKNDAAAFGTEINSITLGGSYRFPELKITPSWGVTYSNSKTASNTDLRQWDFRIVAAWRFHPLDFSIRLQRNIVEQLRERNDIGKSETYIQTAVTFSF